MIARFHFLALALFLVAALAAGAQDWQTYSYPADGFSISAPQAPVLSKQSVPGQDAAVEMHNYLADMGFAALYASVTDEAALASKNIDEALKGAEQGAIDNVHGHLVSDRRITLGDYPGLALEVENDSAHFSARIYIVRSTLYLTLVVSGLGKPYPDADRFLDSFRLIPRTAG